MTEQKIKAKTSSFEKYRPKVVLSIAGFDPTGGAGILADSRTVNRFGLHGVSLITCQTSQNSKGLYAQKSTPISLLGDQLKRILEDFDISAIKVGLITQMDVLDFIVSKLSTTLKSIPVVVDPIVAPTKSNRPINSKLLESFKDELFPLASVITPNLSEFKILSGMDLKTKVELEEAAKSTAIDGPGFVAITGIGPDLANKKNYTTDMVTNGKSINYITHLSSESSNSHGSGCIYSSSIAANLALGHTELQSAKVAAKYVHGMLKRSKDYEFTSTLNELNEYGPLLEIKAPAGTN